MGGGDLNLKKSWHPSTFHNLEKVWKLEQRHEAEKKKIEQLQEELRQEHAREEMQRMAVETGVSKKRDDRVEWLYSGPGSSVNRDEYLLGKRIDKAVDPTLVEEEREKQALETGAGALFTSADGAGSTADLAVKVREDPLFLIRKKEEEAKKLLASNPVKMKQLQQLVLKKKHGKSSKKRSHAQDTYEESKGKRRHTHHREHQRVERPHSRSANKSHTRHMDAEELKQKREEMAQAAKMHERGRELRLRRHEVEREKEEKGGKERPSSDFLQSMRVKSLTSAQTVQERIHRNISSVQRTSAALEGKFVDK